MDKPTTEMEGVRPLVTVMVMIIVAAPAAQASQAATLGAVPGSSLAAIADAKYVSLPPHLPLQPGQSILSFVLVVQKDDWT